MLNVSFFALNVSSFYIMLCFEVLRRTGSTARKDTGVNKSRTVKTSRLKSSNCRIINHMAASVTIKTTHSKIKFSEKLFGSIYVFWF